MFHRRLGASLVFALFLILLTLVLTHAAQQNRTLVVTGHPGELPVVEMGGHSYIEIEALARLANGSLSFQGHQIVLTLPSSGSNAHATVATPDHSGATGFTKEFLRAAIEQMSVIREWRSTLTNAASRQAQTINNVQVTVSCNLGFALYSRTLRLLARAIVARAVLPWIGASIDDSRDAQAANLSY